MFYEACHDLFTNLPFELDGELTTLFNTINLQYCPIAEELMRNLVPNGKFTHSIFTPYLI